MTSRFENAQGAATLENLEKLNSDLGILADELLEKGEMTDREARRQGSASGVGAWVRVVM